MTAAAGRQLPEQAQLKGFREIWREGFLPSRKKKRPGGLAAQDNCFLWQFQAHVRQGSFHDGWLLTISGVGLVV
jgi:hypothetical protein